MRADEQAAIPFDDFADGVPDSTPDSDGISDWLTVNGDRLRLPHLTIQGLMDNAMAHAKTESLVEGVATVTLEYQGRSVTLTDDEFNRVLAADATSNTNGAGVD